MMMQEEKAPIHKETNGLKEEEKQGKGLSVTVNAKHIIKPTHSAVQEQCHLTTFDLPYVTFHYNQKLMVYPSPQEGYESWLESLKTSLAETLSYFYPLAGRLSMNDTGILKVVCNDAGVEFIEATSNNITTADLSDTSVMNLLIPFSKTLNLAGSILPLLAVQVTKLEDAVVMGISINHVIVDGYSTWHFMSSWAHLSKNKPSPLTIPLLPTHDRAAVRNTEVKLNITLPTTMADLKPNDNPGEAEKKLTSDLSCKIFNFTKETMDLLKQKANEGRKEGKPLSTFQTLGGHIWKHVSTARELKPEDLTVFTFFIDCRSRLRPAVGKDYFGNVIQGIYGATAVGALVGAEGGYAGGLIQHVIDGHSAEAIEVMGKAWEANPKLYDFTDAGLNCVTVGSSPRFDVYGGNDFGWGMPSRVRSGPNNKFDGMVYLYPGPPSQPGSIDVEISLHPHAMVNLEADERFVHVI